MVSNAIIRYRSRCTTVESKSITSKRSVTIIERAVSEKMFKSITEFMLSSLKLAGTV